MKRYNVRVYGVYIHDEQLLVSDEFRMGMPMTKLPGGGMEFGEGPEETLKREWKEELAADIQVGKIFYVNPFFQASAFNPNESVLCLYYPVRSLGNLSGRFSSHPMDFLHREEGEQVFRWISLNTLKPEHFTFPIDQSMAQHLIQTPPQFG